MIKFKSIKQIELIKKSSILASKTLGIIAKEIKPGINGIFLDKIAEDFIRSNNGIPAFLGLYGFPNTLCISPNEKIVHGIPNKVPFKDGDIVSIDCGVLMNNYYSDVAYTFNIGLIKKDIKKLLDITKKSLYIGISNAVVGNNIGNIGFSIENYIKVRGYSIVKEFVGHGIGSFIHEKPQIPNYGNINDGPKIKNGMVLSIEPMVNIGSEKIFYHKDNWTVSTLDNKYSCHYEHNIAIINNLPVLLSTYKYIYKYLGISSNEEYTFLNKNYL